MKDAIGGTSLFLIVLVIMTVFAIYISLSVNWSMAYKAKDEIVFAIEKNKGLNKQTLEEISHYLRNAGYYTTGDCSCFKGYSVAKVGTEYSAISDKSANYCILKTNWNTGSSSIKKAYYSVRVFFKLDIPIIRSFQINVDGETKLIENSTDITSGKDVPVERSHSNMGFVSSNGEDGCDWSDLP